MTGRVVVVGSINLDVVVSAGRLPAPGETVLGGELQRHPGGKGANQAVAAARAGARVAMVGAVGDDAEGRGGLEALAAEGVDLDAVARTAAASGVAIIAVDPAGRNQIVVAPGANALLGPPHVDRAFGHLAPGAGDVVLVSLEVPMDAVARAAVLAAECGASLVVNPAPAAALPDAVLRGAILTPNRTELTQLSGLDSATNGAERLLQAGARAVVVTLGEDGCLVCDGGGMRELPHVRVDPVVDTTGAGDTFSGVLAAWLASGARLAEAAGAANAAAALSVRAAGARTGMPRRPEIEAALTGA